MAVVIAISIIYEVNRTGLLESTRSKPECPKVGLTNYNQGFKMRSATAI